MPACTSEHSLAVSTDMWRTFIDSMHAESMVAVDIETTGLSYQHGAYIIGVSVGVPGRAMYCPVAHDISHNGDRNIPEGLDILAGLLADKEVRKVFHNATFDMGFLWHETGVMPCPADCTLALAACHDERRLSRLWPTSTPSGHGALSLDQLGKELCAGGKGEAEDLLKAWCLAHGPALLGMTDNRKIAGFRRAKGTWKLCIRYAPLDLVAAYACMDVDLPLRLMEILGPVKAYTDVERHLLPVVTRMQDAPKWIDVAYLERLAEEKERECAEIVASCEAEGWNPFSPSQVGKRLFSRDGEFLPVFGFTANGQPKTDVYSLQRVAHLSPVVGRILRARELRKTASTYCRGILDKTREDGAIFPQFLSWSTQTGRFSSRQPNWQNTPRGAEIRNAVMAAPGEVLVFIDYAQIEPRLMAHFGRARNLIHAFRNGVDVYGTVAPMVFPETAGCPANEIKARFPEQRTVVKVALLAVCYGARGKKLRQILRTQAGVKRTEAWCTALMWKIRRAFPSVFRFVKDLKASVVKSGRLVTPFGRVRHYGPKGGGFAAKEAFNSLVQGTAADVLKHAMCRCDQVIRGSRTRMLMTIHDEIVFSVPEEEVEEVVPCLVNAMERGWPFLVPMKAEPALGLRWGEKVEVDINEPGWFDKWRISQ